MESGSDNESASNSSAPLTPIKKRKITKRLQKFKPEWEREYDWITEDPQNIYNAKCKPCNITFSVGKSGIGQIKQHGETKHHKLKTELYKKTSTLDRFFGSTSSSSSSASASLTCDDKISASELALTYHTVKHNLSYNSMDCTVKLNKIIYADSKTALNIKLGRTKMEALVNEVLGPYALQTLLNDLNAPNLYFCLQTDASNRKNIKLFPLVVQYFDIENGIQNKLLDFYENCDESANGMFDAINNSLSHHNLSFDRVSGLSADNTNANFGIHHSLYKNIERVVPDLVMGICHAHIVHNTVKHAMNFLSIDVENIILKIYSHFSVSAVRREELKKFVAAVEGEWHELKRHVGTRWLSLLPCVDNILLNWKALSDYFFSLELETKRLMKISEKCLIEIGDTIKELVPFEAEMESEKIVPPVVGDQSDCNSVNTIHVDEFLYDQDEVHKMMKDGRLNKHFCLDCNSRNVKDLTLISHSMSRYALQYIFRVLLPADLEEKQILDIGSRLGAVLYGAYHFSNAGTIVGIEMNKECCDVQERIISQYSMDNNRIKVVNSDVMDCSDIVRNSDVIIINVLDFFVDVDKHKQMWYFFKKHIKKGSYIVCNRSMADTLGYLEIFDDLISWLSICKPSQMENEVFFDIEDCNELFLYTAN